MGKTRLLDTAYASLALYAEYMLGLVASILVARALQPAEMGVYGLLVWLSATAVALANAGITLGAIKFVAELQGAGQPAVAATLVRRLRRLQHWTLLAVLAAVLLVLAFTHERLAPGVAPWVLALVPLALALRAPYMLNVALLKGREDFASVAVVAVCGAVLNLAMVVLVWNSMASLAAFMAVYALSSVVFWALSQWRATRGGDAAAGEPLPAPLQARLRHHLRVAAFTSVLGTIGAGELELLPLTLFASAHDAGLFKVASALASGAALLVPGILSAQLLPVMAHARGRGQGEAEARFVGMTTWLLVLGLPLVAFGLVHADAIIELLYGSAYAQAAPVLAALLAARTATVVGQGATAFLLSADRQTTLMWLTVAFTALRLAGVFAATWTWGLPGAIGATLVLSLLASASTILLAMGTARAGLPWWRLARVAVAAALPALASAALTARLPTGAALAAGIAIFALAYPAALWLLRALDDADAAAIAAWVATRLHPARSA